MKHEDKTFLTEDQKNTILTMFWGPYEDSWKENGIIDNRDSTIAKRLNIKTATVAQFLISNLTKKVVDFNENLNKKVKDEKL